MKPKIPAPKIFTEESRETPKHDDFLIQFKKESQLLKKYIEDNIEDETIFADVFIEEKDTQAYRLKSIYQFNERYFYWISKEELPPYWFKQDNSLSDDDIIKRIEEAKKEDKIKELKGEIKEIKCNGKKEIEIIEWHPEKAIMNNSFYIGSVDLFVRVKVKHTFNLELRKEWIWENFGFKGKSYEFIFEFKPTIKSYSETIRQINVYKKYFPEGIFVVITNSNCDHFLDIFKEQKIDLWNIKTLNSYLKIKGENESI